MKRIKWTDGRVELADDFESALSFIADEFPDAVAFDHAGFEVVTNESEAESIRTLVWSDEESSVNDDGSHAIAEIIEEPSDED